MTCFYVFPFLEILTIFFLMSYPSGNNNSTIVLKVYGRNFCSLETFRDHTNRQTERQTNFNTYIVVEDYNIIIKVFLHTVTLC
jgi:hypothetical protein